MSNIWYQVTKRPGGFIARWCWCVFDGVTLQRCDYSFTRSSSIRRAKRYGRTLV